MPRFLALHFWLLNAWRCGLARRHALALLLFSALASGERDLSQSREHGLQYQPYPRDSHEFFRYSDVGFDSLHLEQIRWGFSTLPDESIAQCLCGLAAYYYSASYPPNPAQTLTRN